MYKRIVVKIGSGVIAENGTLSEAALKRIADQTIELSKRGIEVVLVSSGAIATGKSLVKLSGADETALRQVYAAVGQVGLMSRYTDVFKQRGYHCAQVLVTKSDFRDRMHYQNMKYCFENLLKEGIIPIVNENDTVAISQLVFTDNDELAGLIAAQLSADAVIFLTSIGGVMTVEGDDGQRVVPEIRTEDIPLFEKHITAFKSKTGRGGMHTKFAVAKRLMGQGITAHIANGKRDNTVVDIIDGKPLGTKFVSTKKLSAVKRRLAYAEGLTAGFVYVNQGAKDALCSKKSVSLLPVGVTKIEGNFKKGDAVEIRGENGHRIGFGITQYDAKEADEVKGKKSVRALIHYDYLLIVC